jgi:hypothetical protein
MNRNRAIRRGMGLSDHPPIPIEHPAGQVCSEFKQDNDARRIIYVLATAFTLLFLSVLILGE